VREVPIRNADGETVAHAIVDAEDWATLMTLPWHLCGGYAGHMFARRPATPFLLHMHRLLITPRSGCQIDHINGNRLDNRRANLRLCTLQQNQWNRGSYRPGRKKGVTLDIRSGRWRARLQHDGRMTSLGHFETEAEAKAVYDAEARKLRGEFFHA
jgi:hypothetical protein